VALGLIRRSSKGCFTNNVLSARSNQTWGCQISGKGGKRVAWERVNSLLNRKDLNKYVFF
jgi:hypothetical protein